MNNKLLIGIFGLLIVLGVGGGFFIATQKDSSQKTFNTPQGQSAKDITLSNTLQTYTDPSGFSFQYPDNLSLQANEITDNETYADFALQTKESDGKLAIKIVDTTYKNTSDWLLANASSSGAKDVSLGNLSAKQVAVGDNFLVAAVNQGVLFTIHVTPSSQDDFWNKVSKTVLSTFQFIKQDAPANSSADSGSNGNEVTLESEEVIE